MLKRIKRSVVIRPIPSEPGDKNPRREVDLYLDNKLAISVDCHANDAGRIADCLKVG